MPTLEEQTHTSYAEVSRPRINIVFKDITGRLKIPLGSTLKIRHPHVGLREMSQCFLFFFLLN